MDNIKTGALIKHLRKEKSLTQKQVAQLLHITDRAVSKWERGLSAPDVSLLEPLAALLGCSVLDLIRGEIQPAATAPENDSAVQALRYSQEDTRKKVTRIRTTWLLRLLVLLFAVLFVLWRSGIFYVIDINISPDQQSRLIFYSQNMSESFLREKGVYLLEKQSDASVRIWYGNCNYKGSWWAPDSSKYVVALESPDGTHLSLLDRVHNNSRNLDFHLTMGVQAAELSKHGYQTDGTWPEIQYEFLQWASDSDSMLIYYLFEDEQSVLHHGYFWYNCSDGAVQAVLEMKPGK